MNPSNASHRRHLENDVRVAGENAVRFGDVTRARSGVTASVPVRFACLDTLYARIAVNHSVERAAVARAEWSRTVAIDATLVWVPVAVLFLIVSNRLVRRLLRTMPTRDERWSKILLLVWVGVAGSAIAVLVAHLWGWYVEELRLRTNHLSFRARTLPVSLNVWRAYLGAMFLFAMVAARQYRAAVSRGGHEVRRDALVGWQR